MFFIRIMLVKNLAFNVCEMEVDASASCNRH